MLSMTMSRCLPLWRAAGAIATPAPRVLAMGSTSSSALFGLLGSRTFSASAVAGEPKRPDPEKALAKAEALKERINLLKEEKYNVAAKARDRQSNLRERLLREVSGVRESMTGRIGEYRMKLASARADLAQTERERRAAEKQLGKLLTPAKPRKLSSWQQWSKSQKGKALATLQAEFKALSEEEKEKLKAAATEEHKQKLEKYFETYPPRLAQKKTHAYNVFVRDNISKVKDMDSKARFASLALMWNALPQAEKAKLRG